MTGTRYRLRHHSGGVASLQLATDDEPHVGDEALAALADVVAEIGADATVRALVLEGGDRHFCSGATRDTLMDPDAPQAIARLMGGFPRLLLDLPVPTLALLSGHALGGGLMLGLWCDVATLAEESLYGANFLSLGFTPGMGSTTRLAELFGAPLARDLLLTGRMIKGREIRAAAVPISHAVVPRAHARARTYELAQSMAAASPPAMRIYRAHLAGRDRARLNLALADELAMHGEVFAHPDTRAHILDSYPVPAEEIRLA